jgi:hypothetical protein
MTARTTQIPRCSVRNAKGFQCRDDADHVALESFVGDHLAQQAVQSGVPWPEALAYFETVRPLFAAHTFGTSKRTAGPFERCAAEIKDQLCIRRAGHGHVGWINSWTHRV